MELAVRGQAFNRDDARAVGLHGEHRAALDGLPVQLDRASSTERCLATHVGPGQPHNFAQIMDKEQPRLNIVGMAFSVDSDRDIHGDLQGGEKSGGERRYQKLGLEEKGLYSSSRLVTLLILDGSFPSVRKCQPGEVARGLMGRTQLQVCPTPGAGGSASTLVASGDRWPLSAFQHTPLR